jgi:hypothetical protein
MLDKKVALCAEYGSPYPTHVIVKITANQEEIDRWLEYRGEGYDSHYIATILDPVEQ